VCVEGVVEGRSQMSESVDSEVGIGGFSAEFHSARLSSEITVGHEMLKDHCRVRTLLGRTNCLGVRPACICLKFYLFA
jgi:hypothetical protein